jgi:hypothetical protein
MINAFIERTEMYGVNNMGSGISKIIPGDWGKVGSG